MNRHEGGRVQADSYAGVLDIGGTKILAGLINPAGELVARRRIETQAARGADDVIARCAALLRELAQEMRVPVETLAGVGCSVPGPLDRDKGLVIFSPNLGWLDVPLVEMLQHALGGNAFGTYAPVVIDDDAHCAVLGEASRGAARGAVSAVYVTVSTGIGAGVIINGNIYRGAHGFAGEVGHITIEPAGPQCACGNSGCFEALASGSAIAAQAQQAVLRGDQTILANLNADPTLLTAEQVVCAAEADDALAIQIVERAGTYLGIGLAAVATAFDPEMIVVGGGVARPNGMLLRRAREVFQTRAMMPIGQRVRIVPALLGDESGLWGAAALISSGR